MNPFEYNYGIETLNNPIFIKSRTQGLIGQDGYYYNTYTDRNGNVKTLPLLEVRVYAKEPSNIQKVRDTYLDIVSGLRNQGYNNWADAVEDVNVQYGVGNAVAWYQGSKSRKELLEKAKQVAAVTSLKKEAVDTAKSIVSNSADVVLNAGDHIDDALHYLSALLPGSKYTPLEAVENNRLRRQADAGTMYYDIKGNIAFKPNSFAVPNLPYLPQGASPTLNKLYDLLKKSRTNLAVRESQLKKLGRLDELPNTLTAKRYREAEKTFNDALQSMSKVTSDPTKLTRKLKSSYKAEKARATDDLRAANAGRPSERALYHMETIMRNDKNPTIQKMVHQYDLKVAKGMDSKLAKQRLKEILVKFAELRNYKWFSNKYK